MLATMSNDLKGLLVLGIGTLAALALTGIGYGIMTLLNRRHARREKTSDSRATAGLATMEILSYAPVDGEALPVGMQWEYRHIRPDLHGFGYSERVRVHPVTKRIYRQGTGDAWYATNDTYTEPPVVDRTPRDQTAW